MVRITSLLFVAVCAFAHATAAEPAPTPGEMAARVDRLVLAEEHDADLSMVDDAGFLRRISLDVIGRPATPSEVTRFGLNPSTDKRSAAAAQLLASSEYGANWAKYWSETILRRATNVRSVIVRPAFEQWMADNLNENRPWHRIVTDMLTSTGSVTDNGATALLFAHEGEPEEVAAEASRLFMGIQVQCANCHDHPWDRWKRDEFHELVAFFPRVSVRRDRSTDDRRAYIVASVNQDQRRQRGVSEFLLTRVDRNRDQVISRQEAERSPLRRLFSNERLLERVDSNGDGRLTIEEIKTAQPASNNRPGQGSLEHFMPDLQNPATEGTQVDPAFFLNDRDYKSGADDLSRRGAAARFITSRTNVWFARAIVNRMWAEMTGTAFYVPIDDIGPDREATHEAALDALCEGFVASGHDLKWLLQSIAETQVYQRDFNSEAEGFARMTPSRLRSDQLYTVLCQSLGVSGMQLPIQDRRRYGRGDPGRAAISEIFGFDPSAPRDEVTGSIPQSLFLMNSPQIGQLIDSSVPNSPVARILDSVATDEDAISELYLAVLGRVPTAREREICLEAIREAGAAHRGLEDVLWALLNSSELQTKR